MMNHWQVPGRRDWDTGWNPSPLAHPDSAPAARRDKASWDSRGDSETPMTRKLRAFDRRRGQADGPAHGH